MFTKQAFSLTVTTALFHIGVKFTGVKPVNSGISSSSVFIPLDKDFCKMFFE